MEERMVDLLFSMFEEKMAEMCSVVPSGYQKSIVSEDWFRYIDSLYPSVESIRPSIYMRDRYIVPRKTNNIPVVQILAERINRGGFDMVVIEDPGVSRDHIPTWGPNLLLITRELADKALALGYLP